MLGRLAIGVAATGAAVGFDALGRAAAADPGGVAASARGVLAVALVACLLAAFASTRRTGR